MLFFWWAARLKEKNGLPDDTSVLCIFSIRNEHRLEDIIFTQIYVEKASNVIYEKKDKIMQGQNALRWWD